MKNKLYEGYYGYNEVYVNYQPTRWSRETIDKFIKFQQIYNPGIVFDINMLQEQASEEEVFYLLRTGQWKWDTETEKIYLEYLNNLEIVNTSYYKNIKSIYNQNGILSLMAWKSKEGDFLINGKGDYICSNDNKMKKVIDKGYNGIYDNKMYEITDVVNYEEVPGLKILNNKKCNPCEYNCPFSLDNKKTSSVWNKLWNINDDNYKTNDNYSEHKYSLDGYYTLELNNNNTAVYGINKNI
jgi:hypothetical protein